MLSLTRKIDYGLVAMAELARRSPAQASARQIAKAAGVPLPMLTNILHHLLHRGLVASTMGVRGGYRLARPADQISLAELIDALEGPVKLTVCCPTQPTFDEKKCNLEQTCRIKGPVRQVHVGIRQFLSQVTLAQIAFERVPLDLGSASGTESEAVQAAGTTG